MALVFSDEFARLKLAPSGHVAGETGGAQTGLDWDGTGAVRRCLYWLSPFAISPATFLFKVYQRDQVVGVGDNSRYYVTFFWGNWGEFSWGSGYDASYYGAHPYPTPTNTNDGKWEISAKANDFVTRDDTSSPYVTNNAWYSQALVANALGTGGGFLKFYLNLPSVATVNTITEAYTGATVNPPTPSIVVGQSADNGSGASWGGYSRWEEQNAIIRGLQFHNVTLTQAQIVALSAPETDAAVLAECSSLGLSAPWYLNMNPTPTDVTDKSGNGHHGSWDGAGRPDLWTA